MNPSFAGRFFGIIITFVVMITCLVGCSPQGNRTNDIESLTDQEVPVNDLRGSQWIGDYPSADSNGYTVTLSKKTTGIHASIELKTTCRGDQIIVEIVNLKERFNGLQCRITPPSRFFVPVAVEWVGECASNSEAIKLATVFGNSIDIGILLPELVEFDDVRTKDTIFRVVYELRDQAFEFKQLSRAPKGTANTINHIDIDVGLDGKAHVSWVEKNIGDYDNDGEIGVPDITPIAQYFGETTGEIVEKVDGSGDGEIGIPDITTIAENYGTTLVGYNVYRVEEVNGTFTPTIRLPNNDTLTSLASVDRPEPPLSDLFPAYEYIDRFPPADRRFVYAVRPFDGVFEEGSNSFPGAMYSFSVESTKDWEEEQTVSTPFGHAVTVPAGGLPADSVIEIREVNSSEVLATPGEGFEYINGVEIRIVDGQGTPVDFSTDVILTIPIPLGISSITAGTEIVGAKSVSGVDAPALLPVYKYITTSQVLTEHAVGTINEDATAYNVTISEGGTYCLFGAIVHDYDPPEWQGAVGVQSVSVVGDNLVDVYFDSAEDVSTPITYNIYLSTTTPIIFDEAEKVADFTSSPARIDKVRGAADYYIAVRAQDRSGNEDQNIIETHIFVPRPTDSLFLTTDKDIYEIGEPIFLTANVKGVKGKLYQLNAVRVTYTPLIYPAAGSVTIGSFFDYHDGVFFPAPIIPVEGNPSFLEFNVSFAQATKEAPAGSSGDLFEFKFIAYKQGNLSFELPKDPDPPFNPYHFYTSATSREPQPFTWHQGCKVKIVAEGALPSTGAS